MTVVCRPAAAMVITAAVIIMGGCGVRPQAEPEPLPTRLMRGISGPTPAASPNGTGSATVTEEVDVFLLRGGRLVAVRRTVPLGGGVGPRLDALVAGPTPAESSDGITSAIPSTAHFAVRIIADVAVVRAPPELTELTGAQQVLALAQLVYTATAATGVTGWQLTDGAKSLDLPTDSGRLVSRPVMRADYTALAPP
jgi:hypothetical protein